MARYRGLRLPHCQHLLLLLALLTWCVAARAQESQLPPREQWRASSSSVETPAIAAAKAIDGDPTTRWGGRFSAGHWFQLDLGKAARVGGVTIRWDSGFASAYRIQSSTDGALWQTVFETTDAPGDVDYVFFPATQARYLRIASMPRTADWGVSIFEFEPIAARDAPRVTGVAGDGGTLWLGARSHELEKKAEPGWRELQMAFPRGIEASGLEVFWSGPRDAAVLEASAASGWQELATDPGHLGLTSFLAAREPQRIEQLRLKVKTRGNVAPAITRLRVLSPSRVLTPLKRYEIVASRAHRDLFPSSLHRRQVYWTAVGIPAGKQKSAFDEYGNLEAFKGAPLVQPVWRNDSGVSAAAFEAGRIHSLRDGWMPLPAVEWRPEPELLLRSEALTLEQDDAPVTLLRHRLRNTGSTAIRGQLALIVRPLQVNPPWQHGGIAPVRQVAIDGAPEQSSIRVNQRTLLQSLTPVHSRGAAPFGLHGATEITRFVAAGTVPAQLAAADADGLAAALLNYRVELAPGQQRDIVIAFPLGNERIDTSAVVWPRAPTLNRQALTAQATDAGSAFDRLQNELAQQWQSRLGKVELALPDQSLVNMLRAQAAYMLINQSGPAMQPGPRNYNRSFIRDGAATAAVLLRLGMAQTARDYLKWYAEHAVHANGLVSPILNEDGSVNRGFGSDLEHDSQGQFVWLVAEIARLDGGAETVRDYQPKVRLALKYLQELRERTLVPGYQADREAPERFRGLVAPSISHEGYSTPTHSYWDDYWALRGWKDGAWLAEQWGDQELARWAREQYAALRESVAASIRATMRWKDIDFIPASADLADPDPTSVSIALDPCGEGDLLPRDALLTTFDRYLADVRTRNDPGSLWAYTPYEMRNILTYVHLDRPQHANELLTSLMRHRRPEGWHVLAEVVQSQERRDIYLGDMPHTWVGAEYVRAVIGMLMHEAPSQLHLLPGTPPAWLQEQGLRIGALPTAFGALSMSAQLRNGKLTIRLEPGLQNSTSIRVSWPTRKRPSRVLVDGKPRDDYDQHGIRLEQPFATLQATW